MEKQELRQREFSERFSAVLETWRFQVDAYWTRASYFAVFEMGALAALWQVFRSGYNVSTIVFSAGGCALTLIWAFNNSRVHNYVAYWWRRTAALEAEFGVCANRQLVEGYDKRREDDPTFRYSVSVRRNHIDSYRLLAAQAVGVSSGSLWMDELASPGRTAAR